MTARDPKQRAMGWWIALPTGMALVAVGVLVGRTSVRPTRTDVREVSTASQASDDRRLSSLEQEVRRLRAAAAFREEPRQEPADERDETPVDPKPDPAEVPDPAEAERAAELGRAEFLDGLTDRLDTEPRDAKFAGEIEPVISRSLLQHLGPDVRVSDLACGSSMCRASVAHPGSPRLSEDRLADFMLQRGPLGKMSVQLDVREEGVTSLYFMRGEELDGQVLAD